MALLCAGERLVAQKGPDAVNSNQIAREAGVGVGTFYRHFPDKHELLHASALLAWQELGAALQAAVADAAPATDPGLEASALTRAAFVYARDHPDRFRLAFGAAARVSPASRAGASRPLLAPSLRPIERRFDALQRAGRLDPDLDVRVAARAWWSMLCVTLAWWLDDPSRVDSAELVNTLSRLHPVSRLSQDRRRSWSL